MATNKRVTPSPAVSSLAAVSLGCDDSRKTPVKTDSRKMLYWAQRAARTPSSAISPSIGAVHVPALSPSWAICTLWKVEIDRAIPTEKKAMVFPWTQSEVQLRTQSPDGGASIVHMLHRTSSPVAI